MLDPTVPEIWRYIAWGFVAIGSIIFVMTRGYKTAWDNPKLIGIAMIAAGLFNALAPRHWIVGDPNNPMWQGLQWIFIFVFAGLGIPYIVFMLSPHSPLNQQENK